MPKPVSILLVDDEIKNLVALESILETPEYRLVKAQSADETLLALMQEEFAAIVLDVQMPDLSGIELARLIKQRKKTQHIPILFLTAYYQEDEQVVLGYGAGAVDYLTKPVNPAVLRSKVAVFADLFRKTRALAQINSAMADEIIERQRAEDRFRLVVESAPNAMVVVNQEGVITLVNSQTETLFGYGRGELISQPANLLVAPHCSLVPEGSTGREEGKPDHALHSGRELIGRRKDGSEVPIEVGLNPIQSPDGDSILTSIVDITERKRSEAALRAANAALAAKNSELERQAEERTRRIRAEAAQAEAEAARERSAFLAEASNVLSASFDHRETLNALARLIVPRLADCCLVDLVEEDGSLSPMAIADNDPDLEARLTKFRETFIRHMGEGPLGESLQKGVPLLCSRFNASMIQSLARSDEEAEAMRTLGLHSYLVMPLKARGRVLGGLGFITTGKRHYTESDLPLAEELAERAGIALDNCRLYNEARLAREAAEAANMAKDRFLAMLSHELRTPLSPVLHAVTLLEDETGISDEVREAVSTIRRNVQLEARLIDDLLDLARIRNGKLQLQRERIDAHDLLHRTVAICQPEIDASRLKIRLTLNAQEPRLYADPARFQQICWNLITNALKFSPNGGTLSITTSNTDDGAFRVEMADQGAGIEPDKLARIFDAFEQAGGPRTGGLGLGLAICKALVTLHGGSIEAHSEGLGAGSTFVITMPVAQEAEIEKPAKPVSPDEPKPVQMRLLVVEDHCDTAAMLTRLLVRRGYEVRSASSVSEAVELATAGYDFDVLVSDIGLPDGTGVDLIQRLNSLEGSRHFRGIALSGYGMQEDLERSSAAGFSYHLTKPVDFPLLDRTLAEIGQEMIR